MPKKQIKFHFEPELFNPTFLPYLEAEEAIQLFIGNRGSGKTTFLFERAIIFALTKNYFRLVYCRKVANNLRDSLFQGFKDVIRSWNLEAYFQVKESEMDIICRLNGNALLSFGLDKPDKLKGISNPSHVFCDEMTEIDFQDYAALIGLLRTKKVKHTQFWGTFNPEYGFWGREYFFANAESDEIPMGVVAAKTASTLIYKASFKDNPFINAIEYEAKLLELASGDENKLTVWIEGNWGQSQTGNEYFIHFNKALHVSKIAFLAGKPVHNTYDFNTVPYMTLLSAQVNVTETEFQIRIFKEYCLSSPLNSTEAVSKAFLDDYIDRITDLFYYGDSSGNNNIAGKGNVTAFDDVRKVFYKLISEASNRTLKNNPSVLKRRDFINNLLAKKITYNGRTVILIIDEKCKELIKDMQKLKLGENGKLKKRVTDKLTGLSWEELGHCADALEYFIIRLLWDEFKKKE